MAHTLKSSLSLIVISVSFLFSLSVISLDAETTGESYVPPVPDKNTVLSANDGTPDGCGSSRFDCVMGGEAILDKQTGLVWARDTEIFEKPLPWKEAMKSAEDAEIGGKKGWRLPTREELISILDTTQINPALPEGHPFTKMREFKYGGQGHLECWTSTQHEDDNNKAWIVFVSNGMVMNDLKLFDFRVWPVRDGE